MKRLLPRLALLLGALTAPPLLAGCDANNDKVILIVSSLPRTGSAKQQSDTIVNGIRLALDEVNWKVGDYTLTYQDWDDATAAAGQWTAEQEAANADRAAKHPDVMAYIGPFNSGAAKICMPILNRAGVLIVTPGCTWPGLSKPGLGDPGEPDIYRPTGRVNFLSVVPTDDLQGPVAASWAREMGVRRVYILDDNELYGQGIANLFHDRCEELGIRVLGHDSIDTKAQEFKSLMIKIRGKGPDMLYFGGTTQSKGGQIARDMVDAGLKCPLMVPDGCMEEEFIAAAGPQNLNGRCYVTFGGLPVDALKQDPRGRVFVEKYQKRFGREPEVYSIYGYEATRVALAAIRKAGVKDRAAILDAALSLPPFDDVLGRWRIDQNGNTTLRTMSGNIVRDGEFKFLKLLED
jgi:branched-chain amino acid transport system substrate-binding protein